MVDGRLTNYIQEQLHAGFSLEVIRTALLQGGYPQQEIDAAIEYIQQATKTAPLQQQTQFQQQEQMLVNYVTQYLKQGYTLQQIEAFLLQNRYPPFIVKKALEDAQKKQSAFRFPRISFPSFSSFSFGAFPSTKTLLIVFLVLLIVGAFGATAWFFMNIEEQKEPEINFAVTLDIDTVAPGETLYINNDFINFPDKRAYAITLYYTINDKETLTRVETWQLAMDVADSLQKSEKHTLSRNISAGEYELDVKLSYGTTTKQARAYFTVSTSKEELAEAEKEAEAKQAALEQEAAEDAEKIYEETEEQTTAETTAETVETTTEAYSTGADDYKNYASAKELAATDAASAITYCELVVSMTKKDECYWAVAKASGDKSYCETIVADNTRDACWIGFAFDENDYTVCEEIANPFIKQSCEQLEKVAELKAQTMTY